MYRLLLVLLVASGCDNDKTPAKDAPPQGDELAPVQNGDLEQQGSRTGTAALKERLTASNSSQATGLFKKTKSDDRQTLAKKEFQEPASSSQTSSATPNGGAMSGGTSVGTIGQGRRGLRSGAGSGGSASTGTPVLRARMGKGALDKMIIRRFIRRSLPKVKSCHGKQTDPGLVGTVDSKFLIGPDGAVMYAVANGIDPQVSSCVAEVLKAVKFPKPKGATVEVKYPFHFSFGTN